MDVFEVRERASNPTARDIRRANFLSCVFDRSHRFVFATDEKDGFALCAEGSDKCFRCVEAFLGLFEVKNVCAVFGSVEKGTGSRVATRARVAKMRSGVV